MICPMICAVLIVKGLIIVTTISSRQVRHALLSGFVLHRGKNIKKKENDYYGVGKHEEASGLSCRRIFYS